MTDDTSRITQASDLPASDKLLDGILERAVNAAQRNAEQFARLAALARAIEQCGSSPVDRAKLLFKLEEITSDAEMNAQLDVELFRGLRDGQVMKRQIRLTRIEYAEHAEPFEDVTFVAPSTHTKH
ncbi:hypothetical protein [Paraburkholderia sp.]|jgi:hypothetical protein|uniref:hypothetical protein n=1 Tax=Paraburkholderia sp. TaxID=1926495 RepID=UPI002F3EA61A